MVFQPDQPSVTTKKRHTGYWQRLLAALLWCYLFGLFGWAMLRWLAGDRWLWLFLLNTFAFYLFVPLPLVVLSALFMRSRQLWIGVTLATVLAVVLYGPLWFPYRGATADGPTLTVMTWNLLTFHQEPERALAALQASDADVIALQELNLPIAAAIAQELRDNYPYQLLLPHEGFTGMGLISRYPLAAQAAMFTERWVGDPQLATLTLDGTELLLVNIHALPPDTSTETIRERERQAQRLHEVAEQAAMPVIVMGDLNAGDMSVAYEILTQDLQDAWRVCGWGTGHTFPGADSPGSSRPHIFGIAVPMWLIRIDYIFFSDEIQCTEAMIGPWDGVSDHRSVITRLLVTPTAMH
ncbi:MAG: hypothetical protein HC837_08160 [Chloroflexaceae bacterium]|nr:hypothetical protein [Chloroflexaceae bacterium]